MTVVSSLVIEMAANMARLKTDMDAARKTVEGATASMAKAAQTATKALGVLGAGVSVAGLVGMVNQFARASTELSNFSRLANSTAEDFQKISFAASKFGVSQEKLADILKDTQDKVGDFMQTGGGAMADFFEKVAPKVGVTADQFRKLNGADALQLYVSSLEKANLSQSDMVFYMEAIASDSTLLLPLLKDNGAAFNALSKEAEQLGLIMSNDVIKAGQEFDQNMGKISASIKSLTVEIAGPLMSALANMTSEFLKAIRAGDTFFGVIARGLSGGVVGERSSLTKAADDVGRLRKELEAAQKAAGNSDVGTYEQTRVGMLSADLAKATKNYDELAAAARRAFAENDPRRVQAMSEPFVKATKQIKEVKSATQAANAAAKELAEQRKKDLAFGEYMNKQVEERAKREAELVKDMIQLHEDSLKPFEQSLKALQGRVESFKDEEQALAMSEAMNISLAEAVERVNLEKLKQLQIDAMGNPDAVANIQRQIDLQKEYIDLVAGKQAREATSEAAKKAAADWKSASDKIEGTITDALMRGFESGKDFAQTLRDTVVNMFKTMVLRPTVQMIVGGMGGMTGGSAMAGGTGGGGGIMGQLGQLGQLSGMGASFGAHMGTGFMHSLSGFGHGFGMQAGQGMMAAGNTAGGMGMMAGTAAAYGAGIFGGVKVGRAIGGGYSTNGGSGNSAVNLGTAAGAILGGPLGALLGGALGGAFNRAFGRKLTESGITGEFGAGGFSGESYTYEKGGLFRSNKTRTSALDADTDKLLDDTYKGIFASVKGMGEALGLGTSALDSFTYKLKLNFKDLTEEQINVKLAEQFGLMGDAMAKLLLTTTDYSLKGETALQTLQRLGGSLQAVNGVLGNLNQNLLATSLAGGDAAAKLIDVFGGLENFTQATGAYYQAFYSESERNAKATEQMTKALSGLGLSMPASIQDFRKLAEAQDLNTEAGRKAYAALMLLAPAFAQVANSADQALQRISQERERLELELLQAQGNTTELRARERNALDASNRGLYDQIKALEDAQAAQEAYTQAVESAQATLAAALDRVQSAQNAVDAVRERGTNAYLQALSEVAAIQDQIADQARQTAATYRDLAKQLREYVTGIVTPPSDSFAKALTKALGGDREAMAALPGLATSASDQARDAAGSRGQFAREQARILSGVLEAAAEAERLGIETPAQAAQTLQQKLLAAQQKLAEATATANAIGAPLVAQQERLIDEYTKALAALATANTEAALARAQLAAIANNTSNTATHTANTAANTSATGALTDELKKLGTVISVGGLVKFDPNDPIRSVFDNISKTNNVLTAQFVKWLELQSGSIVTQNTEAGTIGVSAITGFATETNRPNGAAGFPGLYILQYDSTNYLMQIAGHTASTAATLNNLAFGQYSMLVRGFGPGQSVPVSFRRDVGSTEFFATGAAFTNGIATRPTAFGMGMMGEAGPEAIMPLSNINGSLGVLAQMPGNEALVAEVRALREEVVNLHAAARAGAMASQDHLQLTRRMTHNGQSMPVTGVQNDPLKVEVAA